MNKDVTEEQIGIVVKKIQDLGHEVNISRGTKRTVTGAIGEERKLDPERVGALAGLYIPHDQYPCVAGGKGGFPGSG